MLDELRIAGVGVIEDAHIAFGPGMTALTGETGAGKTMVLTGLALLMGAKADAALVRHGDDLALVEGALTAVDHAPLLDAAEAAGGTLDDGALLLSRQVPRAGRARASLAGRAVPAATLGEVTERYVTVHGQSDQSRLRSPAQQRAALDEVAGTADLLARYRTAFAELQAAERALEDWEVTAGRLEAERLRWSAGLEEIEKLDPYAEEDSDLRAEAEKLTNVEDLRESVETALAALDDDVSGAAATIALARRSLTAAARYGSEFTQWAAGLGDAAAAVADVQNELAAFSEDLEADPERLAQVHARRAGLVALMRAYGPELSDVLAWAERARTELAAIDAAPQSRADVADRVEVARAAVTDLGADLTAARTAAGRRLARAVTAELAGLAMKGARFAVAVRPVPPGPSGCDEVTMTLAAHPGDEPQPLARSASGGELSRIMLALEVALAVRPGDHTFVFDEVDAGVGGAAATEVGRRLSELARRHQVIVVTHLAQVAAFADHQLVVAKVVDGEGARTSVRPVEGAERIAEIARMLSGETTPEALRHAETLLTRSAT